MNIHKRLSSVGCLSVSIRIETHNMIITYYCYSLNRGYKHTDSSQSFQSYSTPETITFSKHTHITVSACIPRVIATCVQIYAIIIPFIHGLFSCMRVVIIRVTPHHKPYLSANLLKSQLVFVYPGLQRHVYRFMPSSHIPLTHGLERHSLISEKEK